MSEQKMREALEQIKALTEIPFAHTAGDHELIYQIATEALAQQPAVVELTDAELESGRHQVFSTNNPFCPCDSKKFRKSARWAISVHEAKKNGGGV